jgi:hypothetical protein
MGSRTAYFRECRRKRRSKLRKVKIVLPQRLAWHLEAKALEAEFDLEGCYPGAAGKGWGVNGKEVTDPRTFTSLFSPSLIPNSFDASKNSLSVSGCRQIHRAPGNHQGIGSCRCIAARSYLKVRIHCQVRRPIPFWPWNKLGGVERVSVFLFSWT